MTPKDHVAVGQSFEDKHERGTLFTVTAIKRVWSPAEKAERWHVTLMCVVSPWPWFRPGGTSEVTSYDGTLQSSGYRRVA